jgi:hypothetical protein
MRAALRYALLLLGFLAGSLPCWARGNESAFTIDVQPRVLGVDVGIGYRGLALLPDADTTIWAYLGGGYEWLDYYRVASGALIAPGGLTGAGSKSPGFTRIEGAWRLGIEQGFAWNERTNRNLVGAYAYYRGRVDSNQIQSGQLLYASTIPDRAGLLLNTIQVGCAYDDVLTDPRHKSRSGISAEASAEWGPRFFFNALSGDSDYLRFNATFSWFQPLYDVAPDRPVNLLTLYLGEYFSLDYAAGFGAPVPLYIRQTFGGRNQLVGLGAQVRGVDAGSLDTNLKAVNNLELRANGPALFHPDIIPGLVVFWDSGYYNQVGEAGISAPASGFVTTIGAGGFLTFLDIGTGAGYVTYRLDNVNADGTRIAIVLEFGLHF